jgi:hypothetical protein
MTLLDQLFPYDFDVLHSARSLIILGHFMIEGYPYKEIALLEEVYVPEVVQLDKILKDRSVSHCASLILI